MHQRRHHVAIEAADNALVKNKPCDGIYGRGLVVLEHIDKKKPVWYVHIVTRHYIYKYTCIHMNNVQTVGGLTVVRPQW